MFWKQNESAYAQSIEAGYKKGIARSAGNLSMVYETQSDYKKSLEYALKSESVGAEIKDTFSIANAKLQIGNIYFNTQDFSKAHKIYAEAYAIGKKRKDYVIMGDALSGISNYYQAVDSVDKSLEYAIKSLDCYKHTHEGNKLAVAYLKMGIFYFYGLNNVDSAVVYLEKAEHESIISKDNLNLSVSRIALSDLYKSKKEYKKAESYLNSSLENIREYGDKANELKILSRMARLNYAQNKYKDAYNYLIEAYNLKDTVFNSEKTKEITTAKLSSEFSKEKELMELKRTQEQEILNQKIEKEHAVINYLIVTASLLLLLAIVIFRIYRLKHKSKSIIEAKNREITDSIQYARGIQQTILPILPAEAKVIYKPKDIVSGDFYWYKKIDGVEYYAVADCTGHGVPGALLSMLCTELLNACVGKFPFPCDMLAYVHKELKSRMEILGRKDGMEIALITYDREKKYLTYSGANRDLYLMHGNKLEVLKATKHGIGADSNTDGSFGLYTTNVLTKCDVVYLITDGYTDQFGANGKKFGSKQFKEFISMKPDIELIDKTLDAWQGNTEQTDDICVMKIEL